VLAVRVAEEAEAWCVLSASAWLFSNWQGYPRDSGRGIRCYFQLARSRVMLSAVFLAEPHSADLSTGLKIVSLTLPRCCAGVRLRRQPMPTNEWNVVHANHLAIGLGPPSLTKTRQNLYFCSASSISLTASHKQSKR
jgi:hypothetical protein